MRLLTTLPNAFVHIVGIILKRDSGLEDHTLDSVAAVLIEHEAAGNLCAASAGSSPNTAAGTTVQAVATNTNTNARNSGKYAKRIKGRRKNTGGKPYDRKPETADQDIVCFYCTKKGYTAGEFRMKEKADEIRKEHRHGRAS